MKTDVIVVSSDGSRMENALIQTEKMAAYKGLSPKAALHLRLLTEEMMGMMRSITGETDGKFWVEDEDGEFRLHLLVSTDMNSVKREELLSAATSGKNESAKGLMGMLRDFFDRGADTDVLAYTSPMLMSGFYESASTPTLDYEWSMTRYEDAISARVSTEASAREAWDQLEKSVVAHVANDVKVSIKGRQVEMIIIKKLS